MCADTPRAALRRCNKLQDLSCFEGDKHTCKEKLQEHNKRRRDRNAMRSLDTAALVRAAEPAEDDARPQRVRRAAASHAAELIARVSNGGGEADGEAVTGSAPRARAPRRADPPEPPELAYQGGALRTALASGDFDLGDYLGDFMLLPPHQPQHLAPQYAPPAAPTPGAALAGMQMSTVHVKLPGVHSPAVLPQNLGPAALKMFSLPPVAVVALARPGCVLLTLDALLDGGGLLPARDAVAALKSAAGDAGSFFRAQRFSVAVPACATAAASFATSGKYAADAAALAPPCTPRVRPLAAATGTDVALRCLPAAPGDADPFASAAAGDVAFAARLRGQALQLRGAGGRGATLLSAGCAGVVLIETLPRGTAPELAPPPRPMLLCDNACIVAEVCAAAVAADASDDAAAADALELAACVLGEAMQPTAGVAVLAAACAAAAERGWAATLTRLLPAIRAAAESAAPPARDNGAAASRLCARGGVSLLHRACAAHATDAAAKLLAHDGLFGTAATRGPDGFTPLHHAAVAAATDGGALAALLTASGDGLVAWFYAGGRDGVTPASAFAPVAVDAPLRLRLVAARAKADEAVASALSRAFLRPELAAAEALAQLTDDDDAAAIVRWMQTALLRDAGDSSAAESIAADDDAGFMRWQAVQGRPLWRVMALMLLLKAVGNVVHCARFLRNGPASGGASARAFVASTPFRNPSTGAAVFATDLPPEVLHRGALHLLFATVLFRVPLGAVAVWLVYARAGWAQLQTRHEAAMCAILFGEAAFFIYTDGLVRFLTGGLEVEWPAKLMALRAVAVIVALRTGSFRTPANRAGWFARSLSCGVAFAIRPALRGRLWHNVGYRITVFLMLLEALVERANMRRLRRKYAAYVAQQAHGRGGKSTKLD